MYLLMGTSMIVSILSQMPWFITVQGGTIVLHIYVRTTYTFMPKTVKQIKCGNRHIVELKLYATSTDLRGRLRPIYSR